ncbi:hypothetical protein HNP46_000410 [Pseudomonas nitritireducens]|uniref:Uncharacterized protein n=1 Tax=Pseudomonas nitroreducens TaxID=46680 RepID=A0A7W7KF12_PSENT|nr:hypothetical protein [Pseudomonas nitritireducens]MBB4861599.1 hypothetical protein [Pseudomonas nitritireducens]
MMQSEFAASFQLSVSTKTFYARIFMAGDIEVAKQVCRKECQRDGLCVTIEPTQYIYTGGEEAGFVVGLSNYPRFPAMPETILARARDLGKKLLGELNQGSFSIMTPDRTEWYSMRKQDLDGISAFEAQIWKHPELETQYSHRAQLVGA